MNDSSAELSVNADGADRIDGSAVLAVPSGEAVRLQKSAAGTWTVIANTEKGSPRQLYGRHDGQGAAAAAAAARANDNTREVRTAREETGRPTEP